MDEALLLAAATDVRRLHSDIMERFGALDTMRDAIRAAPNGANKDLTLQAVDRAIETCTAFRMAIGPALRMIDQFAGSQP